MKKEYVKRTAVFIALGAILFGSAEIAQALDTFLVGPRAMGMGGANVASPVDTNAQYYNPGQFGFFKRRDAAGNKTKNDANNIGRKKWGVDANASSGYRLHNNLGQYIDDLSKIDYNLLSTGGINTKSDIEDLINLVNRLDGLDEPGNGITADAVAHAGMRIGHFGIGANVFFQATGRVLNVDSTNLGLSINGADLSDDITTAISSDPGFNPVGYTPQVFDTAQITQLTSTGLTIDAVHALDYIAAQEGLTSTDIQGTVDLLDTVTGVSGTGSFTLDQNTSTVLLSGFGVLEVPVTYGYAFNDNLSLGVNLKFMKGRVYGNQVLVFDQNSGDTIEKTDEYYEETNAVGIDVGILARFNKINLGLVARNINSPKFDGPTVNFPSGPTIKFDDVTIEPQLTTGIAFIPTENFMIEADLDLTENETTLADYSTQNFGIGLEWNVWKVLALRAGTYKNLAEDDIDWVYTAGLGLNMYVTRLDIAATYSDKEERFDEEDYPKEFKVALELSIDF